MAGSSREMLIAAANDLFYQHGFHAVGLDQILDRVGVTKTTFYNHFESKDDLVIAVLEERDRAETDEIMREMRARADGDAKLEMLVFFDVIEEWLGAPDFRGCMFMKAASEYPSPNDPVHRAALKHGQTLFKELRGRAERAGAKDPEALASQLMLVLTGAILSRQERGQVDQAKSARAAAAVLVGAMC
ncbi:MAG: TetR/AcrR family transcriptional regulator [Phycisphaerales bacterium]|nr:TetR/AcrR family transcriptional regulator [Phycisphaerales bacterium]